LYAPNIGPSYVVDLSASGGYGVSPQREIASFQGADLVDYAHQTIITIHLHLYQIAYAGDELLIHVYRIPFAG